MLQIWRRIPPKVVVEGVDGSSLLSLFQLHEIGVRYIQGYIVRSATPEPRNLEEELIAALRSSLSGQSFRRKATGATN